MIAAATLHTSPSLLVQVVEDPAVLRVVDGRGVGDFSALEPVARRHDVACLLDYLDELCGELRRRTEALRGLPVAAPPRAFAVTDEAGGPLAARAQPLYVGRDGRPSPLLHVLGDDGYARCLDGVGRPLLTVRQTLPAGEVPGALRCQQPGCATSWPADTTATGKAPR